MRINKTYSGQQLIPLHNKAKRLLSQKKSLKEIAKKVGRHERTVRRWRDQFKWEGYKNPKEGYIAGKGFVEKRKEAKKMYEAGDSPKKISRVLSVRIGTIYVWKRMNNWKEQI